MFIEVVVFLVDSVDAVAKDQTGTEMGGGGGIGDDDVEEEEDDKPSTVILACVIITKAMTRATFKEIFIFGPGKCSASQRYVILIFNTIRRRKTSLVGVLVRVGTRTRTRT
eukprot:CAMPEP_0168274508 /NCGR_PEP_ID=MMETSP0141_2-20121125/17330_1 /TAXON_ID=44445 /ORGANISM="Pseudo-nitzschia australis, Strain 10249 10 AB" /LENGTH=110 /DNA_ID=CAMNT_0008216089 /DNA_START=138 /DNA_END=467 /DNA_ORIENTATION=-